MRRSDGVRHDAIAATAYHAQGHIKIPKLRHQYLHTDFPRCRKGGLTAQFWSVYVPTTIRGGEAVQKTLEQIDCVHRLCEKYPDELEFDAASYAFDVRRPRRWRASHAVDAASSRRWRASHAVDATRHGSRAGSRTRRRMYGASSRTASSRRWPASRAATRSTGH